MISERKECVFTRSLRAIVEQIMVNGSCVIMLRAHTDAIHYNLSYSISRHLVPVGCRDIDSKQFESILNI